MKDLTNRMKSKFLGLRKGKKRSLVLVPLPMEIEYAGLGWKEYVKK